jgi:hypothetical protein
MEALGINAAEQRKHTPPRIASGDFTTPIRLSGFRLDHRSDLPEATKNIWLTAMLHGFRLAGGAFARGD